MSRLQRTLRQVEFLGLFVALPAALVAWVAQGGRVPVLLVLWACGLPAAGYLARAAPGELRGLLHWPRGAAEWRRIALQAALGALGFAALVLLLRPGALFDLPGRRPGTWAVLVALYPLLSVVPQEILFRTLFFHRYAPLWRTRATQVLVSGLAFGLAHAFYGHWLTVGLATVGGVLFAASYARTRSLSLVVVEHSLYGVLLFTIGLGRFFAAGP